MPTGKYEKILSSPRWALSRWLQPRAGPWHLPFGFNVILKKWQSKNLDGCLGHMATVPSDTCQTCGCMQNALAPFCPGARSHAHSVDCRGLRRSVVSSPQSQNESVSERPGGFFECSAKDVLQMIPQTHKHKHTLRARRTKIGFQLDGVLQYCYTCAPFPQVSRPA